VHRGLVGFLISRWACSSTEALGIGYEMFQRCSRQDFAARAQHVFTRVKPVGVLAESC
jgi:hypothetical protein